MEEMGRKISSYFVTHHQRQGVEKTRQSITRMLTQGRCRTGTTIQYPEFERSATVMSYRMPPFFHSRRNFLIFAIAF